MSVSSAHASPKPGATTTTKECFFAHFTTFHTDSALSRHLSRFIKAVETLATLFTGGSLVGTSAVRYRRAVVA